MASTTLSFRIAPPLYDLHGASFTLSSVAGVDDVGLRVNLVDSGVGIIGRTMTSGGGSVTMRRDNSGVLHNTRLDVTLPGPLDEWMGLLRGTPITLAQVANRLIDWYRLGAGRPFVRRIPLSSISGFEARDDNGRVGQSLLGWSPGEASSTAGGANETPVAELRDRLARRGSLPVWATLYLDARAEYEAGELRAAVLLANSSMETFANIAFRSVGEAEEVDAAFAEAPPVPFWQLLKRVNTAVGSDLSNTKLIRLAGRVHRYRDDVSHGNPVDPDEVEVGRAVEALHELVWTLDSAVMVHLRGKSATPPEATEPATTPSA